MPYVATTFVLTTQEMRPTPIPATESVRLEDLLDLQMLDTPHEEPFDGIVEVAAALFEVPIALLTLMDADRQWFKANVGAPIACTSRADSFCAHTIMGTETMVVEDFLLDPRFADHPFVAGGFGLRFYAGAPLVTARRQCVGTLCLLDTQSRPFAPDRRRLLERLARQAMDALEMRRLVRLLAEGRGIGRQAWRG